MRNFRVWMIVIVLLAALPAAAQEATPVPPVVAVPEVFERGVALFDAGEYERAILQFNLFLLFNPTSGNAYYASALSNLNLDDADAALQDLDLALSIEPLPDDLTVDLYRVRASLHGQQQRLDEAISDYSAALDLAPDAETFFRRAMVYAAQDAFPDALADFDSALALDAENPVLYVYRALVSSVAGDMAQAAADYYTFVGLIETSRVEGQPIESGGVLTGRLEQGIVYAFPVSVKAGTYFSAVAVSTDQDAPIDTLIVLLDESGTPVAADDDGGNSGVALLQNFVLPSEGDYTLIVANSLGGGSGEIAVQVYLTDEPLSN